MVLPRDTCRRSSYSACLFNKFNVERIRIAALERARHFALEPAQRHSGAVDKGPGSENIGGRPEADRGQSGMESVGQRGEEATVGGEAGGGQLAYSRVQVGAICESEEQTEEEQAEEDRQQEQTAPLVQQDISPLQGAWQCSKCFGTHSGATGTCVKCDVLLPCTCRRRV